MNFLLEKVSFYKKRHPQLLLAFSFFTLGVSLFTLWYLNANNLKTQHKLETYQNLFVSTKNLQKFDAICKNNPLNAQDYIHDYLESIQFLSHMTHRHEHALNPSLPIDFNPLDNQLAHQMVILNPKGLKKTAFILKQPVIADEEDVKQLFTLVEHKDIFPFHAIKKAPYLYFSEFKLKKRPINTIENVFELNYKIETLSL